MIIFGDVLAASLVLGGFGSGAEMGKINWKQWNLSMRESITDLTELILLVSLSFTVRSNYEYAQNPEGH
jgi:hypothetical protein